MDEAESLFYMCYKAREKVFGRIHYLSLKAKTHIADIWKKKAVVSVGQGKDKEANMFKRASFTNGNTTGGGSSAVDRGSGASDVGITNNSQELVIDSKMLNDACQLFKECVQESEQLYGFESADTLYRANRLAQVCMLALFCHMHSFCYDLRAEIQLYYTMRQDGPGEELMKRCVVSCEKVFGPCHAETIAAYNNLASLYQSQKKLADAERLIARCLQAREQSQGPDHPDTQRSMVYLARHYVLMNKFDDALLILTRLLGIRERVLGKEHSKTVITAINIAEVKEAKKKYQEQCVVM
jgi:tetratricopeptide (TPR) repeat protein